jgi:hypothetical protein
LKGSADGNLHFQVPSMNKPNKTVPVTFSIVSIFLFCGFFWNSFYLQINVQFCFFAGHFELSWVRILYCWWLQVLMFFHNFLTVFYFKIHYVNTCQTQNHHNIWKHLRYAFQNLNKTGRWSVVSMIKYCGRLVQTVPTVCDHQRLPRVMSYDKDQYIYQNKS